MLVDLVQVVTRDGIRLDGMLQQAERSPTVALDAMCLVHGTGGNFYSSTLFDALGAVLLDLGVAVVRANTRGHDGISTAVTPQGGRRQGAAYEVLDECRHDLTAWVKWTQSRCGPRVGLLGHSSGAVKALYATAHDPETAPQCLLALSPPRLSYSWFCSGPARQSFLDTIAEAERWCQEGKPNTLMDVTMPLPFVITAAGYLEKYGPEERYNYFSFLRSLKLPTLLTWGSLEVERNVAFSGAPEEVEALKPRMRNVATAIVPGADHFYSGKRDELAKAVQEWLHSLPG